MLARLTRALAKILPERMPEPLAYLVAQEIAKHLAPRMEEGARLTLKHGAGSKTVKDWLTKEIVRGLRGEDVAEALQTQVSWGKRIDSAQWELIGTREIVDERDE